MPPPAPPSPGLTWPGAEAAGIPLALHQHLALHEGTPSPPAPRCHRCAPPLPGEPGAAPPGTLTCGQPPALCGQ